MRFLKVWFQNSRAKDKKSRNQRFTAISDDSNYEDATQYNREGGILHKNVIKSTKSYGSKCNISFVPDVSTSINTNTGFELGDCDLCHLPQVNMKQHAFSVEHICKVKNLLEHTTANVKVNIDTEVIAAFGTDVGAFVESETEKDGLPNGIVPTGDVEVNKSKFSTADVSDSQESNFVGHQDADVVISDRLCTFTRIYKELRLQNVMKQALGNQRYNNCNELEWKENGSSNDESGEPPMNNKDISRPKDKQQPTTSVSPKHVNLMENTKAEQSSTEITFFNSRRGVSESGIVQGSDQQHFNKPGDTASCKLFDETYYSDDNDHSRKSANFTPSEPLDTVLTEGSNNDNSKYKDNVDRINPDLTDNTNTIQKCSTRNESITANCDSSSTSSALTATTASTNLSNSHAKDIIKQIFKCSQITAGTEI